MRESSADELGMVKLTSDAWQRAQSSCGSLHVYSGNVSTAEGGNMEEVDGPNGRAHLV